MDWFSKNRATLAGTVLAVLAGVLHFMAASQTKHPTGWDGYYYVMQVHSWLEYGYLQSPDFSLIYPYFAFMSIIAGDVILGFKIGVAVLSAGLVAAVFYALTKKQTPLSWACVACAYLVFSPLLTYFLLQFPKNALGLIFLVLCFHSKNRVMVVVLFLATVLTHRMTGGFALIGAVIYALRNVSWKWMAAGLVTIVAVSFLPGVLHISDLVRFNDQFTPIPGWPPFSFYRLFPRSLSPLFMIDLIIISILILLSIYFVTRNRKTWSPEYWFWLPVAIISIFPFFKFSAGDVGQRFFLVAPVALIMLIPFRDMRPVLQWAAAAAFVVASFFSFASYRPNNFDPPNTLYSYIVVKLAAGYDHHDYPLVIAHSSLAEIIIFKTDFDALNWLPPEDMQPQHVLRLIKGVNYPDLRKYLDARDRKQLRPIVSGYFALPEDAWQRFVAAASKENDPRVMAGIFSYSNPMNKRPYYLNKGKAR